MALVFLSTPLNAMTAEETGNAAILSIGVGSASAFGVQQSLPLPASDHPTPVDHCAHAHLVTLVFSEQTAPPPVLAAPQLFDTSSPRLESVSTSPPERPPIA